MFPKGHSLLGLLLGSILMFCGCAQPVTTPDIGGEDKLHVVATTTMLADLTKAIGGEHITVSGLMGPGIDPHLYQASAGDVALMQGADVVVYNGLHLEGKMGEIFETLSTQGHGVICIEDGLDKTRLIAAEGETGVYDPHIWFDVSLWMEAAKIVSQKLCAFDPANAAAYAQNLAAYSAELEDVDTYITNRTKEILPARRVLITAHDAFHYFGQAYGFEVRGLQGISTDSEAGTADVSALAAFIVERQIKAVFVESSVPPKTIEALQAAVKAKGFDVAVGGELYSDSLGGENSGAKTYLLTVRANIDTIVDALK